MFEREHHRRIAHLLENLDADELARADCYFGGGTAIALLLGEYRESVDVDFLCATQEGYRRLRNAVSEISLGALAATELKLMRPVRADRYGVRTVAEVDGAPVKVELVQEARISLSGSYNPDLKVPVLSKVDLYAEKLLANADRGSDRATMSRDIIDIAMMIDGWGDIPNEAWEKAHAAYGDHVARAFASSCAMLADTKYLRECMHKMSMSPELETRIQGALQPYTVRQDVELADEHDLDHDDPEIAP